LSPWAVDIFHQVGDRYESRIPGFSGLVAACGRGIAVRTTLARILIPTTPA
jgi:hypothetical protein